MDPLSTLQEREYGRDSVGLTRQLQRACNRAPGENEASGEWGWISSNPSEDPRAQGSYPRAKKYPGQDSLTGGLGPRYPGRPETGKEDLEVCTRGSPHEGGEPSSTHVKRGEEGR